MNPEEFEACKKEDKYEGFSETAMDFSGLKERDLEKFIPTMFEIVPKREEKDPILMYEGIIEDMRKAWKASEEMPFHGVWHHGLSAGILIASLRNNGQEFDDADIEEAMKRGMMIPAGACGFHGVCAAGSGLGIAMSVIAKSTPFHDEERSDAMKASSKAIERIAWLGGPRCCKLSTYTTLSLAVRELRKLGFRLPATKVAGRCSDYGLNTECHGLRCPYFPKNRN